MTLTDVGIRMWRLPISLMAVLNLQSSQCVSSTKKATSFSR